MVMHLGHQMEFATKDALLSVLLAPFILHRHSDVIPAFATSASRKSRILRWAMFQAPKLHLRVVFTRAP